MFTRALLVSALASLAGCDFLSVEAEIPEICMTFHDRMIAGVAPGSPFSTTVEVNALDFFGPWVNLDAEITEARATLTARRGVSDLTFLESVTVDLTGTSQETLSLVACTDYACASDGMVTTLTETPPDGVLSIVQKGNVTFHVGMTGALPETEWVVDVEVCVSGKASAAVSL